MKFTATVMLLSVVILSGSVRLKANDNSYSFLHFTNESGLPSSYVKSITQDQYGFMWLATRISLSRFDGAHYKSFPVYNNAGESVEIYCNQVFMFADTLLVARTNQNEYYYFDHSRESFYPYDLLNNLGVTQNIAAADSGYWVCQSDELYFIHAQNRQKTNYSSLCSEYQIPSNTHVQSVLVYKDMLVALTTNHSLLKLDLSAKTLKIIPVQTRLDNNTLTLDFIDFEGWIWIEDELNGLARINPEDGNVVYFSTEQKSPHFIPHNMVHCFTMDKQHRIWIGTEAGVTIYDPVFDGSIVCQSDLSNLKGLNTDPIYNMFCDADGNVWLGTYFGGINFWSAENSFFRNWEAGSGKWQLGGNVVSCFAEDKKGNLWIGFEDLGLNYLNRETGEVQRITSESGESGLTYNNLHDLLIVDDTQLWIATYTGGINILNTRTGKFQHINRRNTPNLNSNVIYKFHRLGDSIFIATSLGINIYDLKTKQFSKFKQEVVGNYQFESITQTSNKIWFSSVSGVYCYDLKTDSVGRFNQIEKMKNINFVKADSKHNIWIGDCYEGLCCYNVDTEKIAFFNKENGFPALWMFSIEEGEEGWYWASSDKGLIKFNPRLGRNILYDSNSGVPFNQFNYRASFTDRENNFFFGGNNGMVSFNESVNPMLLKHTNVVLTSLQLFNKPVIPGKNSPLKESINTINKVVFNYDQNVFTLEFSGLTYSLNGKCQYAYYLEGFESDWNYVGNRDFATYTNLSPGKYVFHVKGSTNNIFNETYERTLNIVVKPPFYLSKWAFLVYFFLVWVFSILLYRFGKYLEKSRALVEMERREKEHAEEIHNVKLEFFTNISHELKTPLTLILGPLSRIIEEEKLSPASKKRLFGIEKSARRLFTLIDQLLEFRKIENGKERLEVVGTNMKMLGEEIAKAFENVVESNDIELRTSFPEDDKLAWVDSNKIDKIIFNLLSNAFKFTPAGGRIDFEIKLQKQNLKARNSGNHLVIRISDTGKGIKPDMIDRVFERFFQIEDGSSNVHSSGIGLAYVKSLVMLHHGEIRVESERGKGTTFIIEVPASKKDYNSSELSTVSAQVLENERSIFVLNESSQLDNEVDTTGLASTPVVLLVEDNLELLDFMRDILEPNYQIMMACNGAEAMDKIQKNMPDLIVSDVMMPVMDGFELTQTLKADLQTSHIPVILLTAKSGVDNHLKGLNTGADYYIEKPFLPTILLKNIANILFTRKKLIERFKNDAYIQVGDLAASESDKAFMEKITSIIKENISSEFDVSFLVKEMGLSRSLIHMKLKSLVNCSTTEYIRAVRVKEATKLIAEGKCNISEAAYEVGFSSPTYFTRRFKELYGKSPREYFSVKN